MKRSTPLRRTSSLRTRSPLARRTRLSARSKTNSYRKRERDLEYMRWVKRQPCIVRSLPLCLFVGPGTSALAVFSVQTPCSGPVEADHAGERGIGQKADDRTCIPLCQNHHRERTDHMRTFRPLTRDELRAWRAAAIERTQAAWRNR